MAVAQCERGWEARGEGAAIGEVAVAIIHHVECSKVGENASGAKSGIAPGRPRHCSEIEQV
jgi:hypothetical protein